MNYFIKVVITAFIGSMPLVIGAVLSLFVEQAVMGESIKSMQRSFLTYIKSIDGRLERIERYIDAKNK